MYNYDNGNKLTKVEDLASLEGFKNGANIAIEYTYDSNGNMLTDANKGITNIAYNHLNLPGTVTFSGTNKKIDYIYDAVGTKLKKVVTDASSLITTEYAGNYIYENNVLKQIAQPEGYIEPDGSSYRYVYQYRDQIENVRLSYSDLDGNGSINPSTEILHERNYYPFGLLHRGYNNVINGTVNNYKQYQGQEYTEDLGLDTHEWKFRISDPAIGRFWQIDPSAEIYRNWGGYIFSGNRVVDSRELEGLEPHSIHPTQDAAARNFAQLYNGISILENREYVARIYSVTDVNGVTTYSYGVPARGTEAGATPSQSEIPEGTTYTAFVHTHAAYDARYANDVFSGTVGSSTEDGDIRYAETHSVDGYVATPNGSFQLYDHINNIIIQLNTDIVSDPNHPNRLNTRDPLVPITPVTPTPQPIPFPTVLPTVGPLPPLPNPSPPTPNPNPTPSPNPSPKPPGGGGIPPPRRNCPNPFDC